MRLINTQTLELEEFAGDYSGPYAIVSHTWEKDEITLQEMLQISSQTLYTNRTKQKAGYIKIKECARIAAAQGYPYVWIDSCCIDKSSSAELSEAINSMFRWYRRAQVCYAYLADVPSCS